MPKDEGQGLMISAFVSRDLGFNWQLTPQKLKLVNAARKNKKYIDKNAAIAKRGKSEQELFDLLTLSKKIRVWSKQGRLLVV